MTGMRRKKHHRKILREHVKLAFVDAIENYRATDRESISFIQKGKKAHRKFRLKCSDAKKIHSEFYSELNKCQVWYISWLSVCIRKTSTCNEYRIGV